MGPKTAEAWSLTSVREKLIKIGAKVVHHGCHVTFQMAEVAVPRPMFKEILIRRSQLAVSTAFCARIAGLPLANIPKRAILASQPPGIRRMSVEFVHC